MIPINLLPHREVRRKAQQRQFGFLAVIAAVVGIAIVTLVHGFLAQRIDNQQARNRYLDGEITKLDKQIDEIKKLKEQTSQLLARKRVVESLQSNRTEAVRLLDQMVRQLPDGLYLKQVKQTGDIVNVTGYATSNARVSTLMRNFEASPWLAQPLLVEVKSASVDKKRVSQFDMFVQLKRAAPTDAKDAAKPAAAKK